MLFNLLPMKKSVCSINKQNSDLKSLQQQYEDEIDLLQQKYSALKQQYFDLYQDTEKLKQDISDREFTMNRDWNLLNDKHIELTNNSKLTVFNLRKQNKALENSRQAWQSSYINLESKYNILKNTELQVKKDEEVAPKNQKKNLTDWFK